MSLAEPVGLCEGDHPRPLRDVMLHHQHAAGAGNPAARITIRSGISVPSAEPPYSAAFGSWSRTSGLFGDLRFGDVRRIRDHHVDGAVKLGQRRAAGGVAELEMIIIGGQRVET